MTPYETARDLPIWSGAVLPQPLGGGITNTNFVVEDAGRRAVVRIGGDMPEHHILRFNELAASRAAHAAGVSPEVLHHQPGALVLSFVEARTLAAEDIRAPAMLERVVPVLARAHREIPRHLRGPALSFWVFHVIRDYAARLESEAPAVSAQMRGFCDDAAQLEAAVGPVDLVFGHNDMLPGNWLDDGQRLWLIDWDYAGFNSPLFDLGGLAANAGLDGVAEARMLELYFGCPPDGGLWRRYRAMKAAAALRETMWSMVSERHSALDVDFPAYTRTTLAAYLSALDDFTHS